MKGFDATLAQKYRDQARWTRDYIYDIANYCCWKHPTVFPYCANPPPPEDQLIPRRTQATLDLSFYEYDDDDADFDAAVRKLCDDLEEFPPSLKRNRRKWVLRGHGLCTSPAAPAEALFYMLENNKPECGAPYSGPDWSDARDDITSGWYGEGKHPDAENPLSITRFWTQGTTFLNYRGAPVARPMNYVSQEAAYTARLAMVNGSGHTFYDKLVRLSTGNMNYIFGIHPGVHGRFTLPATDLEYSPCSFVAYAGSVHLAQTSQSTRYWSHPTTILGAGGDDGQRDDDTGDCIGGPIARPPWNYTPWDESYSEAFILTDGSVLTAIELHGRLLHPSVICQAENPTSSSGPFSVESNNVTGGPTDYLNGGQSVVDQEGEDWLSFDFEAPTDDGGDYTYNILLRLSNDGAYDTNFKVEVNPGGPNAWSETVLVETTNHRHDYRIVTTQQVDLEADVTHTLKVTWLGAGVTDVSFDSVVIKRKLPTQ